MKSHIIQHICSFKPMLSSLYKILVFPQAATSHSHLMSREALEYNAKQGIRSCLLETWVYITCACWKAWHSLRTSRRICTLGFPRDILLLFLLVPFPFSKDCKNHVQWNWKKERLPGRRCQLEQIISKCRFRDHKLNLYKKSTKMHTDSVLPAICIAFAII